MGRFSGETSCFGGGKVVPRLAPPGTGAPQETRTPQSIPGTQGTLSPRDKHPVLLSQRCLSTSKPLWTQPCAGAVLASAISEGVGDTGCAPSSSGGADGIPRSYKAALGTPEDTAPCHQQPAPTWQETLTRAEPGVGEPQEPRCGVPRARSRAPPLPSPGQGPRGSHSAHPATSTPLAPPGALGQGGSGHSPQGGTVEQVTCAELWRPRGSTNQCKLGLDQVTGPGAGPALHAASRGSGAGGGRG